MGQAFPEVERVRSAVVRAVITPLAFLAALAVVLAMQVQDLVAGARALDRSDEVIARVASLERASVARESDVRGWLLRKDARDEQAYTGDVAAFDAAWDGLVRALGDDATAIGELRAIKALERAWDESARRALEGATSDLDARAAAMDRVRASFRALSAREMDRRNARLAAMQLRARIVLASCVGLTLVAAGAIAAYERSRVRGVADAYAAALASLRAAVEVRDDFIHAASHELKSPLTALRLQAQMIARKGDAPNAPVLVRSVDRLVALVDHLLDASRMTSGRVDLELEQVDLAQVVTEVASRLEPTFKDVRSSLAVDAAQPAIGAWDRLRIEQIATNLLTNAAKYGAGRPVEIRVESDARRACMIVRDHGIGIAPDDRARIFERFARAVPERSYRGLGLGLWIVKTIVEAMGGTIEVESALGQGSTFRVTLPRGEVG